MNIDFFCDGVRAQKLGPNKAFLCTCFSRDSLRSYITKRERKKLYYIFEREPKLYYKRPPKVIFQGGLGYFAAPLKYKDDSTDLKVVVLMQALHMHFIIF